MSEVRTKKGFPLSVQSIWAGYARCTSPFDKSKVQRKGESNRIEKLILEIITTGRLPNLQQSLNISARIKGLAILQRRLNVTSR